MDLVAVILVEDVTRLQATGLGELIKLATGILALAIVTGNGTDDSKLVKVRVFGFTVVEYEPASEEKRSSEGDD